MASVGGDIVEITWNHPTLPSGTLYPKAGESFSYDPGGYRGDDDKQGLDGGGGVIRVLTQTRWSVEGPVANDMNSRGELEKLAALAGAIEEATFTFTHINGTVYEAVGAPVGELKLDAKMSTIPIIISGGGTLDKQA